MHPIERVIVPDTSVLTGVDPGNSNCECLDALQPPTGSSYVLLSSNAFPTSPGLRFTWDTFHALQVWAATDPQPRSDEAQSIPQTPLYFWAEDAWVCIGLDNELPVRDTVTAFQALITYLKSGVTPEVRPEREVFAA